jgi:hypothetical protein
MRKPVSACGTRRDVTRKKVPNPNVYGVGASEEEDAG